MTKRRPSFTMTGKNGSVTVRAWGKGIRIKATLNNGDAVAEMALAAQAGRVVQEVMRSVAGDPELAFKIGPMRHIEDHS